MAAATSAFTSAGTKLYISATAPATYNQAGFAALTFTEIGEIVNMGDFGRTYNIVNHVNLGSRKTVKLKGSYNEGNLDLQLARAPGNSGQALIVTASTSDNSYSFKVVLQDGTIMYFSGQVASYSTNVGSSDQIVGAKANIEINNDIIEVAP